jgi:hypothetical protein
MKGDSAPGIETNDLVEIGNGSIVLAFARIRVAPVAKGESVAGVQSYRLIVIGNGSIVVAFARIS